MDFSALFRWITGGDNQYMRMYGCMKGDKLWIAITVGLDFIVAAGYILIALHWWKNQRLLPDVPTIAESGLPGFETAQRSTLIAPAGTPRPIIERLNRELNAVLATDEVKKRLATEGAEPIPGPPEEYAADIDREETKWSRLVKALGVKAE